MIGLPAKLPSNELPPGWLGRRMREPDGGVRRWPRHNIGKVTIEGYGRRPVRSDDLKFIRVKHHRKQGRQ